MVGWVRKFSYVLVAAEVVQTACCEESARWAVAWAIELGNILDLSHAPSGQNTLDVDVGDSLDHTTSPDLRCLAATVHT